MELRMPPSIMIKNSGMILPWKEMFKVQAQILLLQALNELMVDEEMIELTFCEA